MRLRNWIFVSAVATLVATGPVSAQSYGGGAPPSAQQQAGGVIGRLTSEQQTARFESEEQRRRLAPTAEEAEAQYGAERLELARQIAVLVEARKCDEARAMANAAGERQMALRIRRTCR